MARKTVDELVKEKLAALNQDTEDARAVKEATMKGNVNTFNQQVDASVEQQTGIYEDSIRDAQRAEKAQYDDNYIDELVARKNLENTMADMGLTDSGLNRSQQTAISVMRGNADAKARQGAVDKVQAFRDAINQVMIGGEQQKAAYQQQQSAALSEWYQNQLLTNKQNARTAAVEQYNAETEAIEKQQEAIRKQNETMIKNGYVQDKNGNWVKNNTAEIATYAMTLIKNGVDADEAWEDAQYRYGAISEKPVSESDKDENKAITALKGVTEWDASKGGLFNKTFWSGPEGDGKNVYEDIVREQLKKSDVWLTLDETQKSIAVAKAIGKSVGTTWTSQREKNQEKNKTRIKSALEAAGYKESEMSSDSWKILYGFATEAYEDVY